VLTVVAAVIPFAYLRRIDRLRAYRAPGFSDREPYEPGPRLPRVQVPVWVYVIVVVFIVAGAFMTQSYAIIPPAHRGLKVTLGQLEDYSYPEGFQWKLPFAQKFIVMPVYTYSAKITESTASSDMQEITTQLSVQYKVIASRAHEVYKSYLFDWEITQIKPIIFEEMKATTADWTAEQLIQERPLVMAQLRDQLRHRLEPLGFEVISVNIEDLQFSQEYWDAIERKAVATQEALAEKNRLEVVRFQQQQKILQEQASKNITIIQAEAKREKQIKEAEGLAQSILLEANATAEGEYLKFQAIAKGIEKIKEQLTPEYVDYLVASGWDGRLPIIAGAEGGLVLDLRTLFAASETP
jgi:regulator of protease activity HflC (stomatin/prohibitin superfamily)